MKEYAAVAVPVADLREDPTDSLGIGGRDNNRLSQLLYNEILHVTDEQGEWLRVEAMEQRKFLGSAGWGGYPGWVRKDAVTMASRPGSHNALIGSAHAPVTDAPTLEAPPLFYLSFGTRLSLADEAAGFVKIPLPLGRVGWVPKKDVVQAGSVGLAGNDKGAELARLARCFLGVPYLWGGRSMPLPLTDTGVDCSGLVNLVFRVLGEDVPRDARDLWRVSRPIGPNDLKPGDLVFLSTEEDPESINHVLLFAGAGELIEAPHTGEVVRIRLFSDVMERNPAGLEQHGFTMDDRKAHFGRMRG